MSDYDKEQKSIYTKQHKRMAMGVPIDGQTMKNGESAEQKSKSQPKGGLTQTKKK